MSIYFCLFLWWFHAAGAAPIDGAGISTWIDKSGLNNHAVHESTLDTNRAVYRGTGTHNQPACTHLKGTIFTIANIAAKSRFTLFTVTRVKAIPTGVGQDWQMVIGGVGAGGLCPVFGILPGGEIVAMTARVVLPGNCDVTKPVLWRH